MCLQASDTERRSGGEERYTALRSHFPQGFAPEVALIRDRPQREGAIKAGFAIGLMHIIGCSTSLNAAPR
jgi:hypothetical protein